MSTAFEITINPPARSGSIDLGGVFAGFQTGWFARGRDALHAVLRQAIGSRDDSVAILTTSDSRYVSGCVTQTIEQVGRWTRWIEERTRVVLVIHEWGIPRAGMDRLALACRRRGLLLIEDCAYAIGSFLTGGRMGRDGDFTLFSLPKFFAVDGGGLLLSPAGHPLPAWVPPAVQVEPPEGIIERRRAIWDIYVDRFECTPPELGGGVPGVFLLPCDDRYQDLKHRLQARGIEAGFWYGNQALFLPCHQHMSATDVDRVRQAVVNEVGSVRIFRTH